MEALLDDLRYGFRSLRETLGIHRRSGRDPGPSNRSEHMIPAMIGVAAGLLGALGIARLFATLPFQVCRMLLFDVRPTDLLLLTVVSAILLLAALSACYLPAPGAARVDPVVALR